jgi:hypothetical protein
MTSVLDVWHELRAWLGWCRKCGSFDVLNLEDECSTCGPIHPYADRLLAEYAYQELAA